MYSLDQIAYGLRNPSEMAEHFDAVFGEYALTKIRPKTDFFDEDWDNLLILDACRYDLFNRYDFGIDQLAYRWSPGSNSEEFIRYHTDRKILDDVVWVTANPWVSRSRSRIFKVIDVWDEYWDDELNTVHPQSIIEATREAAETYPKKRIVSHFMQPHYPFIGEIGRQELPTHRTFTGNGMIEEDPQKSDIWSQLRRKEVAKLDVWKAYVENLEEVFPMAQQLAKDLSGKSVITSDHGNAFGEIAFPFPTRIYGHPPHLRLKCLVKVPWIEYEATERRSISPGDMVEPKETQDHLEEKLRILGYRE